MDRLVLKRSADRRQTTGHARIISVISGKGGVGKSVLTMNLAERLAARGARVLTVDADLTGANQHILANVMCDFGLAEYTAGSLSLREAVTPAGDRLDLLASASVAPAFDPADSLAAARFVERLRTDTAAYDYVMIDHSSGVSKAATVLAHASDLNIMVLVPELTSIADCFGLYKHLLTVNQSLECGLLINRAESIGEADFIHKKYGAMTERFVGRAPSYLGYLLEDSLFRKAVAGQLSVAQLSPEATTVGLLDNLAAGVTALIERITGEPPYEDEKKLMYYEAAAEIRE